MANEMSEAENAAFAAMQAETEAPPASEPEPPAEEPAESAEPPESEAGEADEAPEAESQTQPAPPKFVRQEALREERERRQYLEAENRRMNEERVRIDERLRMIEEANRPAPPPEPDENVDPIGTIQYLRKELTDLKQQWAQGSQQWNAQQQAAQEARWIEYTTEQDVHAFKAQAPDYGDAYRHWAGSRHAELTAQGMAPDAAMAKIEQEQFDIAKGALQRGASPAERLYRIAQARGYGRSAAASNGNGRDDGASAQIQRVAAGQQRSPTLSGTGGGAVPTEMTASRLASMSNDDFADWIARNPKKADRLLGYEPPAGAARHRA